MITASRSRHMEPAEHPPSLSLHRELYPYLYKDEPVYTGRNMDPYPAIIDWLTKHGEAATLEEIVAGSGVAPQTVKAALYQSRIPGLVRVGYRTNERTKRQVSLWKLEVSQG